MLTIHLPWRGAIRALAVIGGVLLLLGLAGQFSAYYLGHDHLRGLIPRLNADNDNSLPGWYSSVLFLLGAAPAALLAAAARGASRRAERRSWVGLALLFVLASIEEVLDFHSMTVAPAGTTSEDAILRVALGALVVVALLVGAWYLRFWWRLPARTRAGMAVAAALVVLGGLGVDGLSGAPGESFAREALVSLEEALELAGVLVFLHTLSAHAAASCPEVLVTLRRPTGTRTEMAAAGADVRVRPPAAPPRAAANRAGSPARA